MLQDVPNLRELKAGDETAWAEAFRILWPMALQAAQHPMAALTREEAEEAASDALAQMVKLAEKVISWDELPALAATIAFRIAISLARQKSTVKRGLKVTVSWEANQESLEERNEIQTAIADRLSDAELAELATLLQGTLSALDRETRRLLRENVCDELSARQLSEKYAMPLGTVATKLARGLKKIRASVQQSPQLLQSLKDFLR